MSLALLKKLGIVAGVLLLVLLIYFYRQVPHAKTPFAGTSGQVERVVIEQGSKKIELQKQGSDWKVSSGPTILYTAESSRVKEFLSDLDGVQIEDEISDRADRASDYDVGAESGVHVSLLGAKAAKLAEGIFGKQSPDIAHTYFRYPDKPNVYLARGLLRGELGNADVNFWRNRQLINIPEMKIETITMEGNGFKTELIRTSTDVWTMNGKIIDPTPVNALVGTLAHLRVADFVDPVAFPAVTYENFKTGRVIVTSPETSAELHIGAEDAKSKQYPVSVGKEEGLAWLSESLVHSILLKPSAFSIKR